MNTAARPELKVIGYAVAGRDNKVSIPRGKPLEKAEAERLRDDFTGQLVKGHDWDYRVVAIIELPAQEALDVQ